MTTDERHAHPELEARLDRIERLTERLVIAQEQQTTLLQEVVRLIGSVDERLGLIEEHLRNRPTNGQN
jgi:hypothetical protein